MDDVKTRLAAVRCDAAPYGWSDKTSLGSTVVGFCESPSTGFFGEVESDSECIGVSWSKSGIEICPREFGAENLVPLPAPVAVRDEQPKRKPLSDDRIRWESMNGTCTERELADELIAARERISELEDENGMPCEIRFNQDAMIQRLHDENLELKNRPTVQKLATSGPSITRPLPAVDAWLTPFNGSTWAYRVDSIENINGETRIISGGQSVCLDNAKWLTGPTDRGPWRPIGEVR